MLLVAGGNALRPGDDPAVVQEMHDDGQARLLIQDAARVQQGMPQQHERPRFLFVPEGTRGRQEDLFDGSSGYLWRGAGFRGVM